MNSTLQRAGGSQQKSSGMDYQRIAKGLGWFSVGLGLAEIAAPGSITKLIGVRENGKERTMLRSPLFGMREVAAGIGILTQPQPHGWMWSRVAGDIVDIGSLASALRSSDNDRKRVAGALVAVLGVTALDYLCAENLRQSSRGMGRTQMGVGQENRSGQTSKSVWVNKSPEEVYSFWHNFENLPRFMEHLESVRTMDDRRSHWKAKGPLGRTFEWDAQIEQDQPNRLITWRSVEGSGLSNSGAVRFEPGPGGRGTMIRVHLSYDPPMGTNIASMFGAGVGQMLTSDLRVFKQVMETGEVIQSDASIHTGMHPAQPPRQARGIAEMQPVRA